MHLEYSVRMVGWYEAARAGGVAHFVFPFPTRAEQFEAWSGSVPGFKFFHGVFLIFSVPSRDAPATALSGADQGSSGQYATRNIAAAGPIVAQSCLRRKTLYLFLLLIRFIPNVCFLIFHLSAPHPTLPT